MRTDVAAAAKSNFKLALRLAGFEDEVHEHVVKPFLLCGRVLVGAAVPHQTIVVGVFIPPWWTPATLGSFRQFLILKW